AQARVSLAVDGESLSIHSEGTSVSAPARPGILIVDDNHDLLQFLAAELGQENWEMLTAENAHQARQFFRDHRPGVVLLDYMLGEDDGLKLGLEFQAEVPGTQIIIMTGGGLSEEEERLCRLKDIPILFKPFVAGEVLNLLKSRQNRAVSAGMVGASVG
ncbi:MAG TPA: response regulator, partial [Pyrinomonadaceae bacterium]|nr:response regulator [Pyrinomonadaceae bacterium]